jgi:hypothetical protein
MVGQTEVISHHYKLLITIQSFVKVKVLLLLQVLRVWPFDLFKTRITSVSMNLLQHMVGLLG